MGKIIIKIKKIFSFDFMRYNFSRILTIAEKNVRIQLRFKFSLFYSIIFPLLPIIMASLILVRLFTAGVTLGQLDDTKYLIFIFTAFNIELLRRIAHEFPYDFRQEKFWKTLPALMIAPFNKMHLLLGIFLSHLIIIAIPFVVFILLTYFISPISPITLIFIIFIFLIIYLIFCGIGLFFGVFAISKENYWRFFTICFQLLFYISCIIYPIEVFPENFHLIIQLNPFYYIFDILRITWLENNVLLTITNHPFQFIILIVTATIVPMISLYVFKRIYDKFGIVGY